MLGHEKKLLQLLKLRKAEAEQKSYLLKEEINYKLGCTVCVQLRLGKMIMVRIGEEAELKQSKYNQFRRVVY